MTKKTTTKRRPVHKVQIGRVSGALWANESENGTFHSITLERAYRDKDGKVQSTGSLGIDDAIVAIEVLRLAAAKAIDLGAE